MRCLGSARRRNCLTSPYGKVLEDEAHFIGTLYRRAKEVEEHEAMKS